MAFGTGDLLWKFGGGPDTIDDGSTSSIANSAFSVAADITAWTNDEDAPWGRFLLKCQWATVTSVANRIIAIYARHLDVDSTNDIVAPSGSSLFQRIGEFVVYAAATSTDYYFVSTLCELPSFETSQQFEFYLENLTGQTISAGWTLKLQPLTLGPSA